MPRLRYALLVAMLLALPLSAAAEPMAVLYDGFGTKDRALISGRAVNNDKGYAPEEKKENTWKKLRRSFSLMRAKPMKHATVDVRIGASIHTVKTDAKGYFEIDLKAAELHNLSEGEHRMDARVRGSSKATRWAQSTFFLWPRNGTAVISDIDDTVLDSNVAKKLRLVTKTFTNNSKDMKGFAGAAALYSRFRSSGMPVVFVSSSPTNLHSRLKLFFEQAGFPQAPMLLKRLSLFGGGDSLNEHGSYKERQLARIAKLLPGYKFVLIGDSGQADRDVYESFRAKIGSNRIRKIAIHDLGYENKKPSRAVWASQHSFKSYAQLTKYFESRALFRSGARASVPSALRRNPVSARTKHSRSKRRPPPKTRTARARAR